MTTLYQEEIDSAQEDIAANGAAVAFTRETAGARVYDSASGLWSGGPVTAATSGLAVKGSASRFAALNLVLIQPVTVLVAAKNLAGFVPKSDDIMLWAGIPYTVKDVQDVSPDGAGIVYRVTGSR